MLSFVIRHAAYSRADANAKCQKHVLGQNQFD
jgi:hypothetical protein